MFWSEDVSLSEKCILSLSKVTLMGFIFLLWRLHPAAVLQQSSDFISRESPQSLEAASDAFSLKPEAFSSLNEKYFYVETLTWCTDHLFILAESSLELVVLFVQPMNHQPSFSSSSHGRGDGCFYFSVFLRGGLKVRLCLSWWCWFKLGLLKSCVDAWRRCTEYLCVLTSDICQEQRKYAELIGLELTGPK